MRNAASAMPVGGQTAVALAFRKRELQPSLAPTKYTTARPTAVAILRTDPA